VLGSVRVGCHCLPLIAGFCQRSRNKHGTTNAPSKIIAGGVVNESTCADVRSVIVAEQVSNLLVRGFLLAVKAAPCGGRWSFVS
jgi:hypothetical protein